MRLPVLSEEGHCLCKFSLAYPALALGLFQGLVAWHCVWGVGTRGSKCTPVRSSDSTILLSLQAHLFYNQLRLLPEGNRKGYVHIEVCISVTTSPSQRRQRSLHLQLNSDHPKHLRGSYCTILLCLRSSNAGLSKLGRLFAVCFDDRCFRQPFLAQS